MSIFFSGVRSGDVFNKFATVLEKLHLVEGMLALWNTPVSTMYNGDEMHTLDSFDPYDVPYTVEVWTKSRRFDIYE